MTTPAPSIEIRPAALQDAARIRDLTRTAYARWVGLIGREPLPMLADYDRAVREHAIDLLTVGGALAGLIETILRPDHLWIENVAVAPDRQGRGYGRLLLAHAEARTAESGRGEIRLQTNAAFAANLALYARLGYAIDRTEPFRGGTVVYMRKRIESAPHPEEAKGASRRTFQAPTAAERWRLSRPLRSASGRGGCVCLIATRLRRRG
jgi:GNAT superfamily N-acetyltransferase